MMTTALLPVQASWRAPSDEYEKVQGLTLRTLFAQDPPRGERLRVDAVGGYLGNATAFL